MRGLKERARVYVVYERNPSGLRREKDGESPVVLMMSVRIG
jgi:hypothetical protein